MGNRVLTFQFTAAGTQSWKADRDYVLTGIKPFGSSNALMSTDPSLTITLVTTPAAVRIREDIQMASASLISGVKTPIVKDETYFVTCSAAQTVLFWLESADTVELTAT